MSIIDSIFITEKIWGGGGGGGAQIGPLYRGALDIHTTVIVYSVSPNSLPHYSLPNNFSLVL